MQGKRGGPYTLAPLIVQERQFAEDAWGVEC
jgi:hypothetical protein